IAETPFISEIVKASKTSKKACLIVAKLGIDEWLNGTMVRSLFIKQANILERELGRLGEIVDLEKKENDLKTWLKANPPASDYDYARIQKEVGKCWSAALTHDREFAERMAFLYDRRTLLGEGYDSIKKAVDEWCYNVLSVRAELGGMNDLEVLCNLLCAKTPTPSTVLDVWGATKEFLEGLEGLFNLACDEKRDRRIKCRIQKRPDGKVNAGEVYKGLIDGQAVEVVWLYDDKDRDEAWIIGGYDYDKVAGEWKNKSITFKGKLFGLSVEKVESQIIGNSIVSAPYLPCRTITATPDIFMAIVPADKAVEITNKINDGYLRRFGKVMGRLPMSIGHVFFREKTPMFVVLDSARRMIKGFENDGEFEATVVSANDVNGLREFTLKDVKKDSGAPINAVQVTWRLPFRLGTGEDDWHHPYFIVKNADPSGRKTFFKTVAGDVVHFSDIKENDKIKIHPNRFEYVFLDSTARRYDIGARERGSGVAGIASRSYLLDELGQGFAKLWNTLRATRGMTDTKLRNAEALLLSKREEWGGDEQWERLVEAVVINEFGNDEFVKDAVLSGLFFDCLEYCLRILKKRISDEEGL
ncbi:MAG: hypothetical protein HY886_06105, partial [Deltaproteobacteria bacterium]|nr:hypothetical protein [Deltaproteobacteria bacterium]